MANVRQLSGSAPALAAKPQRKAALRLYKSESSDPPPAEARCNNPPAHCALKSDARTPTLSQSFGETECPSCTHFARSAFGVRCVVAPPKRYGAQKTSHRFICMPVEMPSTQRRTFCIGRSAMSDASSFNGPNGEPISASFCSDATSEERVLANAFRPGGFSSERAAMKAGSSSLKTIILAGGANIRQLQYTTQPGPKISGTGALIVA